MSKNKLFGTTILGGPMHSPIFYSIDPQDPIANEIETSIHAVSSTMKITMDNGQRGIVICNPIEPEKDGEGGTLRSLNASEIRRALLFWDKIVWPSTNGIYVGGDDDAEFLIKEKKILRPFFSVNGDALTALSMAFAETYKTLDTVHPGQWALSNGEESLREYGGEVTDGRGVITRFINAIPVPDRTMPLEDLINFKENRMDEVVALRSVIDEFYQSWVNAEDQNHQLMVSLQKIDVASSNMIKVARQSKLPFNMSSWKVNFSLSGESALKIAAATMASQHFNLDLVSSLVTVGASTLTFGRDIGINSATSNSPFNYVASMERELY